MINPDRFKLDLDTAWLVFGLDDSKQKPVTGVERLYLRCMFVRSYPDADGQYKFKVNVGEDTAYYVSPIPHRIFPVYDWMMKPELGTMSWIALKMPGYPGAWLWDDNKWTEVDLPPAAASGMMAAQLQLETA